jgi:hypothetical protein
MAWLPSLPHSPDTHVYLNVSSSPKKTRIVRPQNDVVYTEPAFAKRIVDYFDPAGFCLDPCRGRGAFYDVMPDQKDWCEIADGKDFMFYEVDQKVEWIITNPPWSSKEFRPIARHAFGLAHNVVFLIRFHTAFGTTARHRDYLEAGHRLKEVIIVPWEGVGFAAEGFALSVVHWQKAWTGDCKFTYWID